MTETEGITQTSSMDIEHLEELIRPIRELSTVWNIPLSEYLDNFLLNLSTIDFQEEYSPEALDFSKVGLFLQGSTNILAKKVKHLYDLATSSVSFETLENGEKVAGKRKRRNDPLDYVVDDKLINIEDPEVASSGQIKEIDESQIRQDITTMPKVPLCLLSAIDTKSTNDNASFRVNIVPDENYSVIMLDPEQKIEVPEEPVIDFVSFPEAISEPKNTEEEEENDPKEKEDHNEEPTNKIQEYEGDFDFNPTFPAVEDEEPAFLDPDSNTLQKFMKPMKVMKRFRIPSTFDETRSKKNIKKPFHNDIFNELFEQVKLFRKTRKEAAKYQTFENIRNEEGHEHIMNDVDLYQDFPEPAIPEYDDNNTVEFNDFEPIISSPLAASKTMSYADLCRSMIKAMVESGEKQVHKTEQNQKLSDWEKKIGPRLEKELKKPEFMIDECEEWALDVLRSHDGHIMFSELTSDLDKQEVSHVFLAILVLANKEKVRIDNGASQGQNFNVYLR